MFYTRSTPGADRWLIVATPNNSCNYGEKSIVGDISEREHKEIAACVLNMLFDFHHILKSNSIY